MEKLIKAPHFVTAADRKRPGAFIIIRLAALCIGHVSVRTCGLEQWSTFGIKTIVHGYSRLESRNSSEWIYRNKRIRSFFREFQKNTRRMRS